MSWFVVRLLAFASLAIALGTAARGQENEECRLLDGECVVVALNTTEPSPDASSSDLAALGRWLDGARIIGLGESPHGVHTLHRLGHRLFAHLVDSGGFTVFAWEVNQAHAATLDDYVQGRRDDLDNLLSQRWWTAKRFYDDAFRDLLRWMRRHNEAHERHLHIAGFDFKQPSFAMAEVVDVLATLSRDASDRAAALYEDAQRVQGLGVFPNVFGFTGEIDVPVPPASEQHRSLETAVQVRGEGVSYGWVGVAIKTANQTLATRWLAGEELTSRWTPIEIVVELPVGATDVVLEIFHRGNGDVWFDGFAVVIDQRPVPLKKALGRLRQQPLQMPGIQAMDYRATLEASTLSPQGAAVRVHRDPAVDQALSAVREVDASLRSLLGSSNLEARDRAKALQMSRLVIQAFEWRALATTNRDALMAENLAWLHETAFPEAPILALASTSHTERLANKMGGLLSDRYGARYRAISMFAVSGQGAHFGPTDRLAPDQGLELLELTPQSLRPPLDRLLSLSGEDFMLPMTPDPSQLPASAIATPGKADVVVFLRDVKPSLLDPE